MTGTLRGEPVPGNPMGVPVGTGRGRVVLCCSGWGEGCPEGRKTHRGFEQLFPGPFQSRR